MLFFYELNEEMTVLGHKHTEDAASNTIIIKFQARDVSLHQFSYVLEEVQLIALH